jgi:pimeloyl-ACP methyl ester carboxylesterase
MNALPLPEGITARRIPGVNGLTTHLLEAGDPEAPLLLLLHGFPELAYSWRHVMLPLAEAGFRVVAPDQRGYGRTTGWSAEYDTDLAPFRLLNLVRDQVALVGALGRDRVAAVIGHDFGSPVAAACALARPDLFGAVALMSAPFAGAPPLPTPHAAPAADVHAALAALDPPRKHYQWHYATPGANAEMMAALGGLAAFLRAYFHMKSGAWPENEPFPLQGWTAGELAKLPRYYVMDAGLGMAAQVAVAAVDELAFLPPPALAVFAEEYGRTGFQGGLHWYRCATTGLNAQELLLFAGRRISIPATFIAGARDWGIHQVPGALARMQQQACADFRGLHLVPGAGHWVQQERPAEVVALLLDFLRGSAG